MVVCKEFCDVLIVIPEKVRSGTYSSVMIYYSAWENIDESTSFSFDVILVSVTYENDCTLEAFEEFYYTDSMKSNDIIYDFDI